jgi:hypothetical protein
MLLARLQGQGKAEAAAMLQKALDGLDPELLAPDRGLLGPNR